MKLISEFINSKRSTPNNIFFQFRIVRDDEEIWYFNNEINYARA